MLIPETPFPQVGSYALCEDEGANQLTRILERRGEFTMVSFPLREGASGTKVVPHADLIDASPLTAAEEREFHDLDRTIHGRPRNELSPALRKKKGRRDALRQRMIYGPIMDRLLRFARALQEKQQQRRPVGWAGRASRGMAA